MKSLVVGMLEAGVKATQVMFCGSTSNLAFTMLYLFQADWGNLSVQGTSAFTTGEVVSKRLT